MQVHRRVSSAQPAPGDQVRTWRNDGGWIELQERQAVDHSSQVTRPLAKYSPSPTFQAKTLRVVLNALFSVLVSPSGTDIRSGR